MAKDIEQLDAVLLHSSLSEIAQELNDIASKDWWWDFGAPVITAAIVALIASGITFWYTYHLHNKAEKAAEWRYNKSLIDQRRRYFEEQAEQDRRHKEDQLVIRENLNREAINELILLINTCYTTLAAVRENYSDLLSNDINERMFQVPILKGVVLEPVDKQVLTRLFFLVPPQGEEGEKWSQLGDIEMVLANYNTLARLWMERNVLREDIQRMLTARNVPLGYPETQLYSFLDPITKQTLMSLTERVVSLSRELYVDFGDFLAEFHHAYKPRLNPALPKDLLTPIIQFEDWDLERRHAFFENEALPDLEVLRPNFDGNDELFERHTRAFKSRHDK